MKDEIKKIYIPARFSGVQWSDVPIGTQKIVDDIKESKKGLFIHGVVGSGKTHIAYAIAKHVQEDLLYNVRVWNSAELLNKIRDTYNHPESDFIQNLLTFRGLLVIDDIGAEKLTDWVAEQFYILINKRYEEMLPMVITSNFSLQELAERLNDRTTSRIAGMCEIIELKGNDRRL